MEKNVFLFPYTTARKTTRSFDWNIYNFGMINPKYPNLLQLCRSSISVLNIHLAIKNSLQTPYGIGFVSKRSIESL
jgi:hypothetical protein